ncbi:Cytochrome P450 4F12 [Mycena sanguinolenta]|uniref:Cytochrome P450 4F12 n=1 Tax=Mycena sanguinolenta TaxID=230812 RepID=A0A8H6YA31_9AGAR|nr:Cytochrome P450 4F12 [Mycena sanguinolenta]
MSSTYLGVPGFLGLLGLWACSKLVLHAWHGSRTTTTKLRGPPSSSRLFGLSRELVESPDNSVAYEDWAASYGPVFEVPLIFGRKNVVLTDPKALVHFYSSERAVYGKTETSRLFIGRLFGRGVLWAEGDTHKRQRKALTPAFSNAAIRRLTTVFFDSAYKLKSLWDATLETTSDGAVIEVEQWMNRVALDSIGIAGFSHDFRYLDGQQSPVTIAFEAMAVEEVGLLAEMVLTLSFVFPILLSVPTQRMRLFWELRRSLNVIAERLLANTRRDKEEGVAEELTDKSIIGLLLKAEVSDAELHMTQEEVVAQQRLIILVQQNVLLFAGYETTSISLTWALIELSRHPEIQDKLRNELLAEFGGNDPTWDQLVHQLPYLDATVHEVLRLHPPIIDTLREAFHDDVIPLGTPVVTPSGETISNITIAKGTTVYAPIRCINRSEALWGPDAKDFKPERWFEDVTVPAKDLQGHRHLLTFHDGPRTCLGKSFALAEFKAVLSVLIRNYVFELPDGPETKIETHVTIVPRPKVAGQDGAKVPLKVRRVE